MFANEDRTEELRRRLRKVQTLFLPSRVIYVPVGRRRHRVYRIAVEVGASLPRTPLPPFPDRSFCRSWVEW